MEQLEIDKAIEKFMHPTVYTGVKPILLVAEELPTAQSIGQVVEAVWMSISSKQEFKYISKFAVSGKIVLGKYYKADEIEPFHGRVALPSRENLKNVVMHKECIEEIKRVKAKRSELLSEVKKNFDALQELYLQNEEIYLFEKKDGDWEEELFSDLDINTPYKLVSIQKTLNTTSLFVKNPKKERREKYLDMEKFYGFFVGSYSEIAGLKLKGESYLQRILSLEKSAKLCMKKIDWLNLDDKTLQDIVSQLPQHPFEEYFPYVKKEKVRKVAVDGDVVDALKGIIMKHMPHNNSPLGMEYIAIDQLLYLFHMVISREEALKALETCDIVYEPPGVLLGHGGERKLPPKFLVPIAHVAYVYQQFPHFMSVCEDFINEKVT